MSASDRVVIPAPGESWWGKPRGTFSKPVYVEPVYGHGDLAHRIAEARYWERYLGVKTPLAIEQIIQSWELDL